MAFGRRDTFAPGYPAALDAAAAHGCAAIERLAGGRAAVYHAGTLEVGEVLADEAAALHLRERFVATAEVLVDALRAVGVDARIGSVPGEYCPGDFSVNARGARKLAGSAQRVVRRAAYVGTVLVVSDAAAVAAVVRDVYAALGLEVAAESTGAVDDERPGVGHGGGRGRGHRGLRAPPRARAGPRRRAHAGARPGAGVTLSPRRAGGSSGTLAAALLPPAVGKDPMRRLIAVPFVIAAAFALTACGTKTIDAGSLEDDIQTQLADAAKVKPDTVKVSCPEDKEAKKGNTFDCTITTNDGSKGTMTVKLTNDEGGYTATAFKPNTK